MVGDLYQLPPVMGKALFTQAQMRQDLSHLSETLWHEFKFCELTTVVRQKDEMFSNMLNTVRTKRSIENSNVENSNVDMLLRQRNVSDMEFGEMYPADVLHVYAQNKYAHHRNDMMLEQLGCDIVVIKAKDAQKDMGTGTAELKMPEDPQKTSRLHSLLKVGIGARVMLTNNVDVTDGLTNGAMGKITHIIKKNDNVECILVKFDSDRVGRQSIQGSSYKSICQSSVPIKRFMGTFFLDNKKSCEVSRYQFPLYLAWAITIHKVQGMTVDEIVIDMSRDKGSYKCGQAYVALSRVRTYEKLHIVNYDRKKIKASPSVTDEMNRLRGVHITSSDIDDEMNHLIGVHITSSDSCDKSNCNELVCKVLNVEGLDVNKCHIDEFVGDVDVLWLTETHLKKESQWNLTNVNEDDFYIFRCNSDKFNTGGVALCVKKDKCTCRPEFNRHENVLHVYLHAINIHFVCVYRQPKMSSLHVLDLIEDILPEGRCIVAGDFNENLMKSKQQSFINYFSSMGFKQIVLKPTTNYGSLIDHVYVRDVDIHNVYKIRDCYFSYHDMIHFNVCC